MAQPRNTILAGAVEAAGFIAERAWIIAAVGVAAALLLRNYSVLLFIVILTAFWQLLWMLVAPLLSAADTGVRLGLRVRLTSWGFVYCGVSVLLYFLSVSWGLNLVYLTTAFLLAGLLCSILLPLLMLGQMEAQWRLPDRIFAGRPFRVELDLANPRPLLGAYALVVGTDHTAEQHVMRLEPKTSRTVSLQQYLPQRGQHRLPAVSIRTCFPFGILEAAVRVEKQDEVLVLPRLGHIRQRALLHQSVHDAPWLRTLARTDAQGEFRSLREYKYGDNPRHIHWPTTARLHRLHVREFERRDMRGVLLVLDAHAPPEPLEEARARMERFEKAVSFAATLAAALTEQGVDYAVASYCPDPVFLGHDCGTGHFYDVTEALALAQAAPDHTLSALVAQLGHRAAPGSGLCIITAGPLADADGATLLGPMAAHALLIDASTPQFDECFSI